MAGMQCNIPQCGGSVYKWLVCNIPWCVGGVVTNGWCAIFYGVGEWLKMAGVQYSMVGRGGGGVVTNGWCAKQYSLMESSNFQLSCVKISNSWCTILQGVGRSGYKWLVCNIPWCGGSGYKWLVCNIPWWGEGVWLQMAGVQNSTVWGKVLIFSCPAWKYHFFHATKPPNARGFCVELAGIFVRVAGNFLEKLEDGHAWCMKFVAFTWILIFSLNNQRRNYQLLLTLIVDCFSKQQRLTLLTLLLKYR